MRIAAAVLVVAASAFGQAPSPLPAPAPSGGNFANSFPQRPPGDPAVVNRGKQVFEVNCAFCHGSDARGGDGGPNLIRSQSVLADNKGEVIGPILRDGRTAQGMPKFELTAAQITDVAAFLHSFRVAGYDAARNRPATIVVGNAAAGKTYFAAKCASCHSMTGDLAGISSKFPDARNLQQRWLMPTIRAGNGLQATAVVTLANGQKAEGRINRIDDFIVSITDKDGTVRSFRRQGDVPKVEVKDLLKGHKDLLPGYTDSDIHNLTAYLVTLR